MWFILRGFLALFICSVIGATEKQLGKQRCTGNEYSSTCFKIDILRLLTSFGNSTRLPLAPGVALVGTHRTYELAKELEITTSKARTAQQFEEFLSEATTAYLGSLNLTFQLKDSNLVSDLQGFTGDLWTGRGVKKGWYFIGTVTAIGFSVLALLSGSALVASIIALSLTLASAFRGPAGYGYGSSAAPGRITQYEIVSRPMALPTAPMSHEHHHSAYTQPNYAYARKKDDFDDM